MQHGGVSFSKLSLAQHADMFLSVDGITVGGGRALFEERYKQLLDPISSWSDKIRV